MKMNNNNDELYIKGSILNKVFIDKVKDYEIIEDLTGVGTALADLEESFNKILHEFKSRIENLPQDDYDSLLEIFVDLWMELKHIDYHIEQSEPGFLKLNDYLSQKLEK
jgi:hypothetical protein